MHVAVAAAATEEEEEEAPRVPTSTISQGIAPTPVKQKKSVAFDGQVHSRKQATELARQMKGIHLHRSHWLSKTYGEKKSFASEGSTAL